MPGKPPSPPKPILPPKPATFSAPVSRVVQKQPYQEPESEFKPVLKANTVPQISLSEPRTPVVSVVPTIVPAKPPSQEKRTKKRFKVFKVEPFPRKRRLKGGAKNIQNTVSNLAESKKIAFKEVSVESALFAQIEALTAQGIEIAKTGNFVEALPFLEQAADLYAAHENVQENVSG